MTELTITNYRSLNDVVIPLSQFVCLIGENNSGKSSVLQALSLFHSSTTLKPSDYFDESQPIRIEIAFEGIGDADLARLAEEHRGKIRDIIETGRLTLVRSYGTDGKGVYLYSTFEPTEHRFSREAVKDLLFRGKAGQALTEKVIESFPELVDVVDSNMDQSAMRHEIKRLGATWPVDQQRMVDSPLPTGIDKSITPLLPTPIYVPAVKDLADDVKTSERTPFGKILLVLFEAVEASLADEQDLFEVLNKKINRVVQEDGTIVDNRLDEVRLIEESVQKFVQESFANVELTIQIPPPALRSIFSSAQIYADDGVDGLIDTKGDGLRRTIVFAILRTYVELHSKFASAAAADNDDDLDRESEAQAARTPYLLLFEEPELFLHPNGQHALFDALRVFAKDHHVAVSTHSPAFLGPSATETFVKLRKTSDSTISDRPFTVAQNVDLSEMTARDQFQIICFENNNAALFADTVVLVEGDSDFLVLPHIARALNPAWDSAKLPLHFARITGKGNIRRYRDFFRRFEVRVPVIADLDLLVKGFSHIDPSDSVTRLRNELLAKVDALIDLENDSASASGAEARSAHKSRELRGLWRDVKERTAKYIDGTCTQDDLDQAVKAFFAWQRKSERLDVLQKSSDEEMLKLKWRLLDMLRQADVYVLERGSIEEYYPDSITGPDKPSRAQDFCSKTETREAVLECCGEQEVVRDDQVIRGKEFQLIFDSIFRDFLD